MLTALQGRGSDNLRRFVEAGGQVALGNDADYIQGLEIGMPLRGRCWMKAAGILHCANRRDIIPTADSSCTE